MLNGLEVYTVKEIQELFKCGKRQAYELMRSPSFPSIKVGGRYIVEKSALQRWFSTYEGSYFII